MSRREMRTNAQHFHLPVLLQEVIEIFDPKPGKEYIDATVGEGGHAIEIAKRVAPSGKVLGIDWDPEILEQAQERVASLKLRDTVTLVQGSFAEIGRRAGENGFREVNGILFDLGFSSWHIEKSGRGFSFEKEEPLDMRYDPSREGLTAAEVLERFRGEELERIFREYGEERFAKRIAREILKARQVEPSKTTFELVECVKRSVPRRFWPKGLNVATKTFQALRIAVNHEFENLSQALPQALELLRNKGALIVISFHSGEDRIVKKQFQTWQKEGRATILTKKPITPSAREAYENPRARSAKLRASLRLE